MSFFVKSYDFNVLKGKFKKVRGLKISRWLTGVLFISHSTIRPERQKREDVSLWSSALLDIRNKQRYYGLEKFGILEQLLLVDQPQLSNLKLLGLRKCCICFVHVRFQYLSRAASWMPIIAFFPVSKTIHGNILREICRSFIVLKIIEMSGFCRQIQVIQGYHVR